MSDLTITQPNVERVSGSIGTTTAGSAVTAGQPIYLDATDSTVKPASSLSLAESVAVGVALNNAATGQPVTYQLANTITIGATLTVGVAYYVSLTPGSICLESDVGSGEFPTLLGFAISTTVIALSIQSSGVAKA